MTAASADATRLDVVHRLRDAGCVFAEDEAALLLDAAQSSDELRSLLERRVGGEPLEYILGWVEFCGRRVTVSAGVFVPRRRTEFLVTRAIELAGSDRPVPTVVVDLCCGSGALGLAVADALGALDLVGADLDPVAVRCATANLAAVGGTVYAGDLFDALPDRLRGRVDVLIANAPYVPTEAIGLLPPEARDHEARMALDGGPDGLDVLRRVLHGAASWLAPGGHVLVESSATQAAQLIATAPTRALGFEVVADEETGTTVVIGHRPVDADQ